MIDRASVEHGARLAAEATPGPWWVSHHPDNVEHFIEPEIGNIDEDKGADAAFIAYWNPEFAVELARELQRLWRVEEALKRALESAAREAAGGNIATYERLTSVLRPRPVPTLTEEQRAQIAACPPPEYHETHRYCL